MAATITPGYRKTAIRKSSNIRMILRRRDITVYSEIITNRKTIFTINLSPDIPTRTAVMTAAIGPGHYIVAIRKVRNRRCVLLIGSISVNPNFTIRILGYCQLTVSKTSRLNIRESVNSLITISRIKICDTGQTFSSNINLIISHVAGVDRNIITGTAIQNIITGTARQNIITTTPGNNIGTVISCNNIVTRITADRISARASRNFIFTGTRRNNICTTITRDNVITYTSTDCISAQTS